MYHRTIYKELKEHLLEKRVTVITGMRRVGKSTALQYLLQNAGHENIRFYDCERIEIRALFNEPNYEGILEKIQLDGLDLSKPAIIALDEIQLVENLPSFIKYGYDTYKIKFLVTGSSSYYLKNRFSESLAGRKQIFEMYPLSFGEFLHFKQINIRQQEKYAWQNYSAAWYNRCKDLYKEFIQFGGFPEVVLEKRKHAKEKLLEDIINSYIELDIKLLDDFAAGEQLYKLIKLLTARVGSKLDYSKLSSVSGINRNKLTAYIQLLRHTYFIYAVSPFTVNSDKEISQQQKIYFSDTGILNALGASQVSGGQLFENAVATQLWPLGQLHYYQKKTGQEIDFIFNAKTAIEVKETAIAQDRQVLEQRANAIKMKNKILISRYLPANGYEDFMWGGNLF